MRGRVFHLCRPSLAATLRRSLAVVPSSSAASRARPHDLARGPPPLLRRLAAAASRSRGALREPAPRARPGAAAAGLGEAPGRFDDLTLSEPTRWALRETFGYDALSDVQAQVLPIALSQDSDLVVRARTGTGKTLTFLVPAVEAILASRQKSKGVSALIVVPTRELAVQIGKEAEALLSAHQSLAVVTLTGGANSTRQDQLAIRRRKPQVIVSTPGRLLEHLERTFLFPTLFEGLQTLILDEADRLLDLGFQAKVHEIIAYLPAKRRSMLFSATISPTVTDIITRTCRGRYTSIDCIGEGEAATALMATQLFAVLPGHQCMPALYNLLMDEMASNMYSYKVLVFFPTARLTAFMAQFFRQQLRIGVYEIHRRRDPTARSATQERFRVEQSGILFSSDVSARGMDYPGVTLVVQFGAPATRDMYIHRVGRTARAGREGRAVLVLGELERGFLRAVDDLPLRLYDDGPAGEHSLRRANELLVRATTSWIGSAPLRASATSAFASLLVHYKATHRVLHMGDDDVVQAASDLLLGCGLVEQPVISRRLAVMLGLERHPQLQIAASLMSDDVTEVIREGDEELASARAPAPTSRHSRQSRRRVPWRES